MMFVRGLRHFWRRQGVKEKRVKGDLRKVMKKVLDKLVFLVVFVGPLLNVPQLFEIYYYKSATGVSAISWFGFTFMSIIWFAYGIVHKQRPILIMNGILMIFQALIAVGALIYR